MKSRLLILVMCSARLFAARSEMHVALCALGSVQDSAITQAKTEAELVFGSAGVQIVWHDCDSLPSASEQAAGHWFVVRLRTDEPPVKVGAASLDVMGKAFVGDNGSGSMADVYLRAIDATSEQYGGDSGVLLGFVVAHELGHLVVGAGHTRDGVMQAAWGKRQMNALRQRWLHFNAVTAERIRRALNAGGDGRTAFGK